MPAHTIIIKTAHAHYVDIVTAPSVGDALVKARETFSVERQISPSDFRTAFVTDAEAEAFYAGTYDPFTAVDAFNARAA